MLLVRHAIALLLTVAIALAQEPKNPLKPPLTPEEEIAKYHKKRSGMHTSERLKGYERRLEMEKFSDFSKLDWRCVGPEIQSGRAIRVLSPKNRTGQLYAALATGGFWRTEDGGISWQPLFDRESSFGIGDFALSKDGQTIWIGTGEANSQRTSYQGTGVFKSTDAGKTWRNMGLPDTNHIGKVLISPRNENVVYVAAMGHLYTANGQRGVFKSDDGGKTWQHVLKINDQTGCIDLAMDPRNPEVLYASMWERERRAWDFRDAGISSAIYKTLDGGRTWQKLDGGLPEGAIARIGLAISESKPDTLYAFVDNFNPDPDSAWRDDFAQPNNLTPRRFRMLTEEQFVGLEKPVVERFLRAHFPSDYDRDGTIQKIKDKKLTLNDLAAEMEKRNPEVFLFDRQEHEVYRSDDAGKSWKRTHEYKFGNHGGYYWGKVRVNPKNPDDLFTCGVLLLRSKDGGKSWERAARGTHVDYHDVWYDPNDPKRIFVSSDGGIYATGDDGKTWRHLNSLPVGQFTTIAVDMKTPYNIYGGLQDNGTLKGPSNYVMGQNPLYTWTRVGGGDGSWVAVDPRGDGDLIYVASQFGSHSAIDQKTGERWGARAPDKAGLDPHRYNWVSPLIISPFHPDILYLGSQFVNRSFDKGRTWSQISGDITKNLPNGDVPFSTIKVLDESPLRFGLIYAGCDDGRAMMSPDGGLTWKDVSTPAPSKWVTRVLASKWDVGTVYVTQSGYRDDDYRPYAWKSTDFGRTWADISGNVPLEFVNVIREDPVRKDILYLGTGMGVFVTFDNAPAPSQPNAESRTPNTQNQTPNTENRTPESLSPKSSIVNRQLSSPQAVLASTLPSLLASTLPSPQAPMPPSPLASTPPSLPASTPPSLLASTLPSLLASTPPSLLASTPPSLLASTPPSLQAPTPFHWEPLSAALPRNPIHDLVIHPREMDIVIGTHGRSVWILNAKPLQALTKEIREKDLHVWSPPDMRHDPGWSYRRRAPWDASPEEHPKVRGNFWTKAAGKGTIKIKDKDGKTLIEKPLEAAKGLQFFEADLLIEPAKPGLYQPKKPELKPAPRPIGAQASNPQSENRKPENLNTENQKPTTDSQNPPTATRQPQTPKDPFVDPFAADRPKYLAPGTYTIEITVGSVTAKAEWKLLPQTEQTPGRRGPGEP